MDPIGAPMPLLKHSETVSNGWQRWRRSVSVSAAAFQSRAPSKCMIILSDLAYSDMFLKVNKLEIINHIA
jgi:hypothetical protein